MIVTPSRVGNAEQESSEDIAPHLMSSTHGSVRSTNHDCGCTNPLTLGLRARGFRSWTTKSQAHPPSTRACSLPRSSSRSLEVKGRLRRSR